jgi:hypothetical protein
MAVILSIFARYYIPRGDGLVESDLVDQKELRSLFTEIRQFVSTRNVLATFVFIIGSTLMVPDVSKAMTLFKARKLSIGAELLIAIELLGDLVSLIGTIIFSRWFNKTSYNRIFIVSMVLQHI